MAVIDTLAGKNEYDGLIARTEPAVQVATVTVAAGSYKRGAVLTGEAGGTMAQAAAALSGAVYVLCDDTEAEAETNAHAYKAGCFVRQKLDTGDYELTEADYEYMRDAGLYTEDRI